MRAQTSTHRKNRYGLKAHYMRDKGLKAHYMRDKGSKERLKEEDKASRCTQEEMRYKDRDSVIKRAIWEASASELKRKKMR